ncbi:hypothetical protein BJN34_17025 [Cupriavidus necator]|uniref:Cytochrome c domain-containing protein n=1 Tax=Cupriavidus necator TaxID=106590 RepID=A0A1U9UTU5_CUPNE|nr:c-type cytochrome [Cupriavidus necator]AQV95585.1 hypothetical protein BJN34_17025 [Cupriavidus necator]
MAIFLRIAAGLFLLSQIGVSSGQEQARIARGKYLMEGVVACGNCHIARAENGVPVFSKGLSGGMVFDEPPFKAYAANITPDPETGIGKWTDAQLGKAIREGVRPDGSIIGPPMPIEFYRRMSDADLAAIIAYLRVQPPVKNVVRRSEYNIPLPPSYGPAVKGVSAPSPRETIKYGRYLADIGHCMECHTPRDERGGLVLTSLGAGGQVFKGPWGESVARNLTPHESGLKSWSKEEIAQAIRGTGKNGMHYKPPMAFDWYKNISGADMNALVAYLGSLRPQPFGGKE